MGLWDVKIAGETERSRFQWTLAGDSVQLRTWHKNSASNGPHESLRYELSASEKTKILQLLRSDHLQGMAKSYKNRCVQDPKTIKVKIQHPKGSLKTRQTGYIHPALSRLLKALRESVPKTKALPPGCPPRCGSNASKPPRKNPILRRSSTARPAPATGGSCMDPDVGIHHEVIDELWRGRGAVVDALVPKGWKLVLRYKPALAQHYLSLSLKPGNPRDPCTVQATIPQSALNYDTLYYYLEAKNAAGKTVTGSGSLDSPHIVTINRCLVIEED